MRQKFPEAEEILKEIKSRYEYEDEEYKIIVPNTLVISRKKDVRCIIVPAAVNDILTGSRAERHISVSCAAQRPRTNLTIPSR